MYVFMGMHAGGATKPAAVGKGATGAREEAEATGGGFWEAGWAGGDVTHPDTSCRGGQTQEMCYLSSSHFPLLLVSSQEVTPWSSITNFQMIQRVMLLIHVLTLNMCLHTIVA